MTAAATATEEKRRAVAFAALVLGAIAMGASVLFVRWADVGPFASAFWRAGVGDADEPVPEVALKPPWPI